MASVEEGLSGCMSGSFCGADEMFGKIKKSRRVQLRDPDRPAVQNSGDALNIPRRRAIAAEGKDALLNSPLIGPGINELANATVGTGRRLKPLFDKEALGWTDEEYTETTEQWKKLYNRYTRSKRKYIDQEGNKTGPEMERQVLEQCIATGECYTLAYLFTDEERPFRTALSIIDDDRIRTPTNLDNLTDDQKKRVIAGHVKGLSGRTSSYFVHDYHRRDPRNTDSPEKFTQVRHYNDFGREQIIHVYRQKMPGMTRGLSDLAASFQDLKCFEKYKKAKLEAAIMQVAMAVVVTSNDKNVLKQIGSDGMMNEEGFKKLHQEMFKQSLLAANESQELINDSNFGVDGVKAIRLLEGESAEILSANSAATNDKQFIDSCLSAIGRNTGGMSRATLTQDFEASYSAARATLISFYRQCENLGHYIVDDWLQSVNALLLEDAIWSGDLAIPNYPDPFNAWMHFIINRELYCGARFTGPAREEIDQAKSMAYWSKRFELGLATRQEFFDSRGIDWQDDLVQQFEEMKFTDKLIEDCPLVHIDPIAYMKGKQDAILTTEVEAPPRRNNQYTVNENSQ